MLEVRWMFSFSSFSCCFRSSQNCLELAVHVQSLVQKLTVLTIVPRKSACENAGILNQLCEPMADVRREMRVCAAKCGDSEDLNLAIFGNSQVKQWRNNQACQNREDEAGNKHNTRQHSRLLASYSNRT